MKKKRLGEILRERNQVSVENLDKAIQDQQGKLVHLGELLLHRGAVSKPDLVSALVDVSRIPYFDCTSVEVDTATLRLISASIARSCCALPLETAGKKLVVVMAKPQNLHFLDELRFKSGMQISPRMGFRAEVEAAIAINYASAESELAAAAAKAAAVPNVVSTQEIVLSAGDTEMEFISSSSQERNVEAMREMQSELLQKSRTTPAVMLVASMIRAAAERRASDIHIEPHSDDTAIRFRVDGMLREYQRIPKALQNSVASRIKILSDMDIAERRAPQDGRFLVKIGGRRIDLRVSTLPTQYGEKVVMRLLEGDAPLQDLAKLGFPMWIEERLRPMLRLPQGMILVTGPTGSGKSTTLYSSLLLIRRPSINIITVEDPVEYAVAGLNQVQVNTKAGLTFASCLRSILRQDPNVIMIGEIRDKETAEIALKAAQAGHLVLSTLHTNDSVSAVTRLLDLGVPGFQIATSLSAIIAQRLIRRLCVCSKSTPTTPEYASQLVQAGITDPSAFHNAPNGCEICDLTGFKGRIGIYEMLALDESIRASIREGGHSDEIPTLARQGGMKLMQEYALEHVRDGLTTLEEVQRVVPFASVTSVYCVSCARELSAACSYCPYCGKKRNAGKTVKPKRMALVPQGVVNEWPPSK
jgi:type IV pilus assembly protein PilB